MSPNTNPPEPAPLPAWTDSAPCRARHACRVCRLRVFGRPFRAGLALQYTLPPGGADFPCPYDVPWDVQTPQGPDAGPPAELLQDPGKPGCGCQPPSAT
jgi:hypothetical protein